MTDTSEADDFVLLSEAIDSLDRLYDGQSNPVDVAAILTVVGTALADRIVGEPVLSAGRQLSRASQAASRQGLSVDEALEITDTVRGPIAERWADLSIRHE